MAHILLIEDDPTMRTTLEEMLRGAGHRVTVAANGAQGVRSFATERPDVVVTDVLMPEKDGIQTLREIRATAPSVPVIVVSGGGRTRYMDFLKVAKEFGAAEVLEKPLRRAALLDALARVLAGPKPG